MVQYFVAMVQSLMVREDEGQGMVEYALIIALVAIVLVAALTTLAGDVGGVFESIGDQLPT